MNQEQREFVKDQLLLGRSIDDISAQLREMGHDPKEFAELLSAAKLEASQDQMSESEISDVAISTFFAQCWATFFRFIGPMLLFVAIAAVLVIFWVSIPNLLLGLQQGVSLSVTEFVLRFLLLLAALFLFVSFMATMRYLSSPSLKFIEAWPRPGDDMLKDISSYTYFMLIYSALCSGLIYVLFVLPIVSVGFLQVINLIYGIVSDNVVETYAITARVLLLLTSMLPLFLVVGVIFISFLSLLVYTIPLWANKKALGISAVPASIMLARPKLGRLFIRLLTVFLPVAGFLLFIATYLLMFNVNMLELIVGYELSMLMLIFLAVLFAMFMAVAKVSYQALDSSVVVPAKTSTGANIFSYLVFGASLLLLWQLRDLFQILLNPLYYN